VDEEATALQKLLVAKGRGRVEAQEVQSLTSKTHQAYNAGDTAALEGVAQGVQAVEAKMPRTVRAKAIRHLQLLAKHIRSVGQAVGQMTTLKMAQQATSVRREAMCASSAELAAAVAEQASALGRKYRLLGHDSESEAMQKLANTARREAARRSEEKATLSSEASTQAIGEVIRNAGSLTERLERDGMGNTARRLNGIMAGLSSIKAGAFMVELKTSGRVDTFDQVNFDAELAAKLAIEPERTQTARLHSGGLTARGDHMRHLRARAAPITSRATSRAARTTLRLHGDQPKYMSRTSANVAARSTAGRATARDHHSLSCSTSLTSSSS